jgi:hypothetical protein
VLASRERKMEEISEEKKQLTVQLEAAKVEVREGVRRLGVSEKGVYLPRQQCAINCPPLL